MSDPLNDKLEVVLGELEDLQRQVDSLGDLRRRVDAFGDLQRRVDGLDTSVDERFAERGRTDEERITEVRNIASALTGLQSKLGELTDVCARLDELENEVDTNLVPRQYVDDLDKARSATVEDLSATTADLKATAERLGAEIKALQAGAKAAEVRVPWWPALTTDQAEQEWKALGEWLRDVIEARFPLAAKRIRGCWFQHPDVVDQLSALRAMWRLAYDNPAAEPIAATDWLDRHLPNAVRHFQEAMGSCSRNHMPAEPGSPLVDEVALQRFVREDARGRPSIS